MHNPPPTIVEQIAVAGDAAARLDLLKPVVFLHIEKTGGSTFLNVVAQFTELWEGCPWASQIADDIQALRFRREIFTDCPSVYGLICPQSIECDCHAHAGLDLRYEANKGHVVSMFRQPEQRIISGYYNNFHSYPPDLSAPSLTEYAAFIEGCQTKMLARSMACHAVEVCTDGVPPTSQETRLALQRLREGFAFVGITEQWDLSLCLFHTKFGGECKSSDVAAERVGASNATASLYDTSELEGFVDHSDGQVFTEALRIFKEELIMFGVTEASCATSCWSFESGTS